jgi:ankyrin repeat protein
MTMDGLTARGTVWLIKGVSYTVDECIRREATFDLVRAFTSDGQLAILRVYRVSQEEEFRAAVQNGHESTVRVLASLGTEVIPPKSDGAPPLGNAAYGPESVSRLIASLGTVVNTRGNNGATPLPVSGSSDYLMEVTALLNAGASRKAVVLDGGTAPRPT